jgi:hypothetical protein
LKLGDFGSAVKISAHTTVPGELNGFVGTQGEEFVNNGYTKIKQIDFFFNLNCEFSILEESTLIGGILK